MRIFLCNFQSIKCRIHHPYIFASGPFFFQRGIATRYPHEVAEGSDYHVIQTGQFDKRVDFLLIRDTHRTTGT